MLVSLKTLNDSTVKALDGDIGAIKDIYFDDRFWTIRFMVVDTHPWLPLSQKVLISPISLLNFNEGGQILNVSIAKSLVKDCPKIEEHETVSREFEKAYFDFFGYGYYWTGPGAWGEYAYPSALLERDMMLFDDIEQENQKNTNHLRSAKEIHHYGIDATDGKKGYVKDIIWDTYSWSLQYLVIDTRDWLPGGKKVLLSPEQLSNLNWQEQSVTCNIDLETIKACPEYHPDKLNDIQYLESVKEKLAVNS